jgi:hypothetical protein
VRDVVASESGSSSVGARTPPPARHTQPRAPVLVVQKRVPGPSGPSGAPLCAAGRPCEPLSLERCRCSVEATRLATGAGSDLSSSVMKRRASVRLCVESGVAVVVVAEAMLAVDGGWKGGGGAQVVVCDTGGEQGAAACSAQPSFVRAQVTCCGAGELQLAGRGRAVTLCSRTRPGHQQQRCGTPSSWGLLGIRARPCHGEAAVANTHHAPSQTGRKRLSRRPCAPDEGGAG